MKHKTTNLSKKDRIRTLETQIANAETAVRLTQMMVQQLLVNNKSIMQDLSFAAGQIQELQYKVWALQKTHPNLDSSELEQLINTQRLKDFNEAAQKADLSDNLQQAETIEEDSVVVITTTAKDATGTDVGIFRSRIKLSESGVPDLINNLLGKKVGEKTTVTLNNTPHVVEVLSVKKSVKNATPISASVAAQ